MRYRIFTPQEAVSWLVFLTVFGILGYIVFDGFMLSIPLSYAMSDVSAIPQAVMLIYAIGIVACFGISRLYKPPGGVPMWVWTTLSIAGFVLGMSVGSGAIMLLFVPFVLPYVFLISMHMLTAFIAWLLSLVFLFLLNAIFVAVLPMTAPYGAALVMIAIMLIAIVGYVGCIIYMLVAMTTIVLSQRVMSLALSGFGNRRGAAIGVASIVKGVLVPFEILFFSAAVFALFVYAHVMVTVAALITLMGSIGWKIGLGYIYMLIAPGLGISAAGVTSFTLTRMILRFVSSPAQRIIKMVQGEYPWLSMLFIAYMMMFFAWFAILTLRIYAVLVVLSSVMAIASICYARRIRAREKTLLNAAISTIVLVKPLCLWLGLVTTSMI